MRNTNFWPRLLVSLRREQRVSQRALSRITGVNRQTIMRFENKNTAITMSQMEKLLAALGYEIEALKADEGQG